MSTKKAVKKAVKKAAKKVAVKKAAVKKAPSVGPKVVTVKLTLVQEAGIKCVQRDNGKLATGMRRKDVDIIRVENASAKGKIKVTLDPVEAAKLFNPIPKAKVTLAPGETVDWHVSDAIVGNQGVKYGTDPANCTGNDQNDIQVRKP